MQRILRRVLWAAFATGWAVTLAVGASRLWAYESGAGVAAEAPAVWHGDNQLPCDESVPQLFVFVHPKCPCSEATVGELARLMTRCGPKLNATVLFMRPASLAEGWEKTHLWASAAAIPGVKVMTDVDGRECRIFGAATSGQTVLYATDGRLLFAGGITESRGHSGDNAGESAIEDLVMGQQNGKEIAHTPVYGCPLFDGSAPAKQGCAACPN